MNEKNKVERIFARKELRMIGAIIGDIVGPRFEWNNHRSKDFELFGEGCFATDDSIMTVAVAKAVTESGKDYDLLEKNAVKYMVEIGRKYPNCVSVANVLDGGIRADCVQVRATRQIARKRWF